MKTILLSILTLVITANAQADGLALRQIQAKVEDGEALVAATEAGLTLYVFDPDKGTQNSTACRGVCAEKWPPVLLTAEEIQTLPAGLGVIDRGGGLKQLTIAMRPVYVYFEDRRAGNARGDGLGGVWHAVRAQ